MQKLQKDSAVRSIRLLERGKLRPSLAPRVFATLLLAGAGSAGALQVTTTKAYDYSPVTGLLIREIIEPGTSHLCLVTGHIYDAFGNKQAQHQRNCNGSSSTFPGATTVEAVAPSVDPIVPRVNSRQITYNSDGSVSVVVTTAASTPALPQQQTSIFSSTGTLVRQSGPNTLKNLGGTVVYNEWAYDGFGRKVLEKRPDGSGTKTSYVLCSVVACAAVGAIAPAYAITTTPVAAPIDLVTKTTGLPNGPYTKVYYDNLDRPIRRETQGSDVSGTSSLVYEDTRYDALGKVQMNSLPYFSSQSPVWTNYAYDKLGRVIVVTAPDLGTTRTVYNGLATAVTNSLSQTNTKTRNVAGDVVLVTDVNNKTLTLTYDPLGNLLQSRDSLGNVVAMQYDVRKRRLAMQDPDLGAWTYGYDALGNLKTQTDARAQVTKMSYDLLDRVVSRQEPNLNSNWLFDNCPQGIGQLCRATADNGFERNLSYDSLGRASGETVAANGKSYASSFTYDTNGRELVRHYPTGMEFKNIYTGLGYLKQVVGAASGNVFWKADSADAQGRLTRQSYLNGFVNNNTYHPLTGRLDSSTTARASDSQTAQSVSYVFDKLGNLKSRTDFVSGLTATYTYDSLNRLWTETRSGGGLGSAQTLTWTYDEIGNIASRSDVGIYAYKPSGAGSVRPHAVTGVTGTVNGETNPIYSYDLNGNLTATSAGGGSHAVTWNSFNMVDSVSRTFGANTNKLDYLYSADHDRVREIHTKNGVVQRTTVYLNSGHGTGLFYEEENGVAGLKAKHYISAGGVVVGVLVMDQAFQYSQQYWHKDHLGSTMAVTGTNGVIEQLAYEPFGKRRNTSGTTDANGTLAPLTDRGFTGHEQMDEVGLINMNGRIFDPAIGRMLSADPLVQAPQHMQSYNRYTYTFNNPLKFTDPSGYACSGDQGPCPPDASAPPLPGVFTWNGAFGISPTQTSPFVYSESSYNGFSNTLDFLPAMYLTSYVGGGGDVPYDGFGASVDRGLHRVGDIGLNLLDMYEMSPLRHILQPFPAEVYGAAALKAGFSSLGLVAKAEGAVVGATKLGPQNIANGARLGQQLLQSQAASVFVKGGLRADVVAASHVAMNSSRFKNEALIKTLTADGSKLADWAKMQTPSIRGPSGPFHVHFYQNLKTGATHYANDFKTIFDHQGVWP